jgi:hypothetical protein
LKDGCAITSPASANPLFHYIACICQSFVSGLLRVLSWSLNGLDVVAQNAVVRTSEDGIAHNTFWLTCRGGEKLEDEEAELLAERVRDFVM